LEIMIDGLRMEDEAEKSAFLDAWRRKKEER
jgi:hypothetical protein